MTDVPTLASRCELEELQDARHLDGIYAGMCRPEEYEHLIAAGLLERSYEGAGGLMGMAKLRLTLRARAAQEAEDRWLTQFSPPP